MNGMTLRNRNTGFTMFELIVVISIVGILTAVGTPTFKYVTASNRISGEVNALLGDMQYARSQAIKTGQPVTICTSTDGTSCAATTINTWQVGWIIFVDANANHTFDNANDTPLRRQPAFTGNDQFVATDANYSYATYNRMGYAPTGAPGVINIQLHDSTGNNQWTRCLAVNTMGSVLTEKYGDTKFGSTTTSCQ
jgi:type IV fimbrial biogenesis protein FimT